MRVIAGTIGGLKLMAPTGTATRPTADRVKEALFSILESTGMLIGTQVLDLFSGSGALGIEALSRGAAHATMVDKSRKACSVLQKNVQHTGLTDQATVLCMDSLAAIDLLARQHRSFDLILLDPPYAAGLQVPAITRAGSLLTQTGILVAEAAARNPLPEQIGQCRLRDRRVYGDTALEFYHLEESDAP